MHSNNNFPLKEDLQSLFIEFFWSMIAKQPLNHWPTAFQCTAKSSINGENVFLSGVFGRLLHPTISVCVCMNITIFFFRSMHRTQLYNRPHLGNIKAKRIERWEQYRASAADVAVAVVVTVALNFLLRSWWHSFDYFCCHATKITILMLVS